VRTSGFHRSDSMRHSLDLLYEVSRSFHELLELHELVPLVIRRTKELLHADGSALLLLDPDTQELFFPYTAEAAPEVDRRLASLRLPVSRGIAGWVVRHGVPQLVADASKDDRWYPDVDKHTGMETRALLSAPLRTRHGIAGVVQVRSQRVGAFTDDDLAFLDALARNIAVAIDNARLYGETKTAEQGLRQQVAMLHREVARSSRFTDIVGSSPDMQKVFRLIEGAVTAPVAVLLRGETGTGKELIARAIHFNGPRRDKPFVAVNCAALSEQLLESELFGHRRGAFTGAREDRKGFFEVASGGTIFLDEVGEMTPAMQVKLLRVLQNGEIVPVGETAPRYVDIRVISATNSDLERDIAAGTFRQDLYYRVNTFPIAVPPLRNRRDDIPLLAGHFLKSTTERFGKPVRGLHRTALQALMTYAWPGNVRELQNEIERAVVLTAPDSFITVAELSAHIALCITAPQAVGAASRDQTPESSGSAAMPPPAVPAPDWLPAQGSLREARAEFEARYIAEVLHRHKGNISAAARVLGLSRGGLRSKVKEYGIR
jgi:transcriptional regulator with GAF, ATPase, and Fis domain